MASHATVTLNQANFDQTVLQSKVPVLVDFWAEWCGPCRMISPLLEQIAQDHAGKVVVGKVNVDQEQALASKYGIQSIPAFFIFKNGQIAEQFVGAQHSRQSIEAKLGVA
ncbi:MAG: thioredoxin [Verrucomicrobia bacterium]|nr:thioredoxin [Verrucomicrobiota bacterium]